MAIKPRTTPNLEQLANTHVSSPADQDVLTFAAPGGVDNAPGVWINKQPPVTVASMAAAISAAIAAIPPSSGGGGITANYHKLTATGQTFTVPAGTTMIRVRIIGGGAGGGGGGGNNAPGTPYDGGIGGGAGEVKEEWLAVTSGHVLTATIGAGGATTGGMSGPFHFNSGGIVGKSGGTTQLTDTTSSTLLAQCLGGSSLGIYALGSISTSTPPLDGSPGNGGNPNYTSNTNNCIPFMGVVGGTAGCKSSAVSPYYGGIGGVASTAATNALVTALCQAQTLNVVPGWTYGLDGASTSTPGCGGGGGGAGYYGNMEGYGGIGGHGGPGLIEIWY